MILSEAEVDEDGEHLLKDEPLHEITPPLPEVDRPAPSTVTKQSITEEKKLKPVNQNAEEIKMLATPAVRRLAVEHNVSHWLFIVDMIRKYFTIGYHTFVQQVQRSEFKIQVIQ